MNTCQKAIDLEKIQELFKKYNIPEFCPTCGSKIIIEGIFPICKNPECGATGIAKVRTFLINLGIQHVSLKTLENLGIDNFEKLISFTADKNYKVQTRFESDLRNQMWAKDELTLFKALPFRNVAEKTLDKIIDFYGWEWLKNIFNGDPTHFWDHKVGFPAGVGEKILESFVETAGPNFILIEQIMNDERWTGKTFNEKEAKEEKTNASSRGSVCFTGKLENFSRKDVFAFAEKHGFTVLSGVSKGLTYLVTNSSEMTSKMKNAIKFGTKIITENEFLNLCK